MNSPTFRTTCFILLLGFLVSGLSQAGERESLEAVQQETRELLDALQTYGADQRDEALRKTEEALARLDQRIQGLESRVAERWQAMDTDARDQARRGLRELRRQRIELAEWYGGLKNSSVEAWGHVKQGFSEAYGTMQEAWREAAKAYDQ